MKEYEATQIKVLEMLFEERMKKYKSSNIEIEQERCKAALGAMVNVLSILDYSVHVYHEVNTGVEKVRVRKRELV